MIPSVDKCVRPVLDRQPALEFFTRETSRWWPRTTRFRSGNLRGTVNVNMHVGGAVIATTGDVQMDTNPTMH